MAVARRLSMAAALLLVSLGLLQSSPLPACPELCTCQRAPLLNCSSSGISVVPEHIRDTVTELDLSHNLIDSVTLDHPLYNLRNVWLGNNSITRLSLCMERNLGGRHVGGRYLHFLRPWSGQGCISWAPSLQLLSVERNQLEQLPEGLEGSESLQILQLSFNKISTLRPGDLSPLQQLIELHLQHNQISSLHPQMFEDLAQLQVLDLSFNKLTSIHPLMYLSLRNIGADVRLSGNQWHCDCSMRSLRRRLVYDSSRELQTWSVVCSSPSILSGRDLLQLEEDDLNCFHAEDSPQLHQDVTVQSGSEVLLTCSAQDTMWLMPGGLASDSQPEAGLLISDFTEKDTGLYVCVSENHEVVSIFNLQISKIEGTKRKTRSLDSQQIISESILDRMVQPRNGTGGSMVSQSRFNLAVCLSVFITFLIAFILGVLLRPCIDSLCRRIIHRKSSTKTHTVSSVEQKQYDNEAYYEDSVEIGNYSERGIDVSAADNMQYYDTVAADQQVNIRNDATIRGGAAHTHANGDSSSDSSSQHSGGRERSGHPHNMESKHIPDSGRLDERRSSSSSSDSSHHEKVFNHTTPKSPQLVRDSAQQRADDLTAEVPGFSAEPFADWSPHRKNLNLTGPDLWQDNGEKFEFSDSPRSASPRSSSAFDSLKDSKQTAAATSNKKMRDDTSSSSEDEHKDRTANSGEYRNDTQRHAVRPKHSSSSHSSDSDGKNGRIKQETNKGLEKGKLNSPTVAGEADTGKKAVPKPRTKWSLPSFGLGFTKQSKNTNTGAPGPSAASASSSSSESESEAKTRDLQVEQKGGKLSTYPNQHSIPKMGLGIKARSPPPKSTSSDDSADDITKRSKNMPKVPTTVSQTKRPTDTKPPSPHSDSSSSSDSEDDTTGRKKMPRPGKVEIKGAPFQGSQTKRPLDIKPASPHSDSSSSSDSEKETPNQMNKHQKETNMARPPTNAVQINRPPNIKAPPPHSSSSSSENEAPNQMKAPEQRGTNMARPPTNVTQINRPPNVKPPSPHSDSSSSSSEDDTPNQKTKQEQGKTIMARPPTVVSPTVSHGPQTQWPAINLEHNPGIKRRLDFKVKSPASDSSSSSDSEKETPNQMKTQQQKETNMARPPTNVTQINRPPNVKPPSPHTDSSSSSSDSENETTRNTQKQSSGKLAMTGLPIQGSKIQSPGSNSMWPSINLGHSLGIKRRLDFKITSQASDSSSSSDSEQETRNQMKTQQQRETNMARPPTNATQINRPPHIKPPSPHSDSSSSSSDSENEKENKMKTQQQWGTNTARLPAKVPQTVSHGPQTQWPVINLEHNPSIKKRLDFKVKSPASDSSSSSDSEKETPNQMKTQQQKETNMARPPTNVIQINRPPNVKPPSPHTDSSSSSDSEDEKLKGNAIHVSDKLKSPTVAGQADTGKKAVPKPRTKWSLPSLGLGFTKGSKSTNTGAPGPSAASPSSSSSESESEMKTRNLQVEQKGGKLSTNPAFKAKSPASGSSSSSESEDDTPNKMKTLKHGEMNMPKVPTTVSQTKRPTDIKPPSPHSDSSSSSDSEDDTPNQIKKPQKGESNMARLPTNVTQINRPPNVKPPSPHTDSSSSSDSEDEKLKGNAIHVSDKLKSPTVAGQADTGKKAVPKPHTKWSLPSFGLGFTKGSKSTDTGAPGPSAASPSSSSSESESEMKTRNLRVEQRGGKLSTNPAFKAKSPASGSSSSSDSEDDTPNQIKKPQQGESNMARLPTNISQIKRPPDNKLPSPHSDSTSSSDSENEQTKHTRRESPQLVEVAGPLFQKSPTGSQWPAVDLHNIIRVKRRLDFKALSSPLDSSSVGGMIHTVEVKREKATKNSSSSSSSSSDEQEEVKKDLNKPSTTVKPNLDSRWPQVNLGSGPLVKRRLDIRAPSPPPGSSSSSSESEGGTPDLSLKAPGDRANLGVPSYQPKIKLPDLNFSNRTKRESSASRGSKQPESSSSGSDSEAENKNRAKQGLGSPTISRPVTTQFFGPSKTLMIHTNQDIKLEKYTVFPDGGDQKLVESFKSTTVVTPELESRWAKMNLNMSRFRKRLEITPRTQKSPSQPSSPISPTSPTSLISYSSPSSPSSPLSLKPDSSSSSSSSDDDTESKGSKTSYRRKETGSPQILKNRPGNVSFTGNSVEVKHSIKKDHGLPVTEVKSNPNTTLTDFGTSNLRRHLDIKVSEKAPATPPSQHKSDSSSSSEDEDSSTQHAGKGWQGRSQLPVVPDNKASQIHTSLHVAKAVNIKTDYSQRQTEAEERKARVELKSQTSGVGGQSDSLKSNMSLSRLSFQRKTSSSSSEDKMTGHRVSDLKLGDPSSRKDLNAKESSTSSSSSSSSSSEDEGHAAKQSRHATDASGKTDESVATYKRSIFKTSSTPSVYYPHNGPTTGLSYRRLGGELVTVAQGGPSQSVSGSNASPASRSMSFDDVARKKINQSQHTTDMDLPPDIRWTGIGRHLSDVSLSSQRRYQDVGLSMLPAESDLPKVYSSNYSAGKSDSTIKQDRSTLGYKYSSPGDKSVSPASTRAFDQFDFSSSSTNLEAVPENKKEVRGLSALRAMSTERRMWDALDGNLDNSTLLVDLHEPQVTTSYSYRRSEDIKPLAQPLTPLRLSSTSVDERGTNLSYGVPHYRRHGLGAMERSPPPIPKTPLPDEAEGLTRRSYQSTRSFDSSNPNISSV